jgi:Family of unknown function (DUF6758)
MHTDWRCDHCGSVDPFYVTASVSAEIVAGVCERLRAFVGDDETVPLWCPWPMPPGWTVTGVGWVGDGRAAPKATAVAVSGPAPFSAGPADVVFIAEELGVGLGNGLGGIDGPDPGLALRQSVESALPHAKVKVAGHPTPMWAVPSAVDRSVYIGEARAMWLYAIAWPAPAGYVLADGIELHDLVESLPSELVYGAPTRRLRPGATVE